MRSKHASSSRVGSARALVPALILSACAAAAGPEASAPRTTPKLVSFPTSDGGVVYADLYGDGNQGVVLAHGGRFDKESWADQAQALAQAGFRVLAIDFRGYGQSRAGGQSKDPYDGLYLDVLAAVAYLRQGHVTSVSVIGASMGGGAAAEAAASCWPGEIDRVVLLAHSSIEHPEKIQGRKLFVVSRKDLNADGTTRLTQIREQYEKAVQPKELLVLDGSAHAQFLFGTEQGHKLMKEILRFLSAP